MATKIVMEALSPTMEEGRLVKWSKQEGDQIARGDVLAEVETDKAVMELVARGEGVLRARLLPEGETAPVGQLLGVIAAADEDIDALVAEAPATSGAAPAAPGIPAEAQATPTGAPPGQPAPPASEVVAHTLESAQATSVPRTPAESQGDASLPPQEKQQAGSREAQPPAPSAPAGRAGNGERPRSSPLARRLATEGGLDLEALQGSGPGGRIIKRDIEAALEAGPPPAAAAARPAMSAERAAALAPAPGEEYRDVPLSQIRKTIARRLSESLGPIPTFYLTAEFDLERVAEMREAMVALGDEFRVSYNDIVLKAVATALTHHPAVNAHWMGDRIRYFGPVHLGMAVAVEEGLITPVIRDADRKGLRAIAAEARALAARARERRLTPEEYTGATFSVSNLGMFGIDEFTAIINPPEAGILAVGALERKPVVHDGELAVRRRMRITMSCDHRVIDGATGAQFLRTLRQMLENPLMLVF